MKKYGYSVVTKAFLESVTTDEANPYPHATYSPDGTEAILTGVSLDEETEGVLAVFNSPARKLINEHIREYMDENSAWDAPEEIV